MKNEKWHDLMDALTLFFVVCASLVILSSCSATRQTTRNEIVTHTDTFYCQSVDTFTMTEYIIKYDSIILRDSIVVNVDSIGNEINRSEWHWNLTKMFNDIEKNMTSIRRDSLSKSISDGVKIESETVIKNELSSFAKFKAALFWYLVAIIVGLLFYIRIRR